jgi:7-alpha-hydroxysteroid dehydrogenase
MNDGDPFRLDGKVAMVTGAGRGIGAAIALAMADAGANVGLVARTESDLSEVADEIRSRGRRAVVMVEDLSKTSDVRPVVDRIASELGALDVLVNNAGGAQPAPFVETSGSQLDDAFHFNVTATFELVKAAVPHLLESEGSSVVNVSSNMGHLTQRGLLVYGTVKAALSHLTRLLAADLAPRIRVNAVAPSVVETTSVRAALTDEMRERIVAATPLRRLARPQDVAWTAVWLTSRASSYVTGQVIDLDGGAHVPTFPRDVPDVDHASEPSTSTPAGAREGAPRR